MVNQQVSMREDEEMNGKPSETNGEPLDSYEKRSEDLW